MALAYSKAFLLRQLRIQAAQPAEPDLVHTTNSFLNYAASASTDDASIATSHSDSSLSPTTSTPRLAGVSFEIGDGDSDSLEGSAAGPAVGPHLGPAVGPLSPRRSISMTDDDATPQALRFLSDDCSDLDERVLMGAIGGSLVSSHSLDGSLAEPRPPLDLEFAKRSVAPPAQRSLLSSGISSSSNSNDPLAQFVPLAGAAGAAGAAMSLRCFFHFSSLKLDLKVRPDAQVHAVIGFALHSFAQLSQLDQPDPNRYNVRLVEDDGEPDDDFPALERKRPIKSYSVDEVVIVLATDGEYADNQATTPFTAADASSALSEEPAQITVRVYTFPFDNILSNVYWTDVLASTTPASAVLSSVCRDKGLEQSDYVIRVVGTRAPASGGSTLNELKPQPLSFELSGDGEGAPELVVLLEFVPRRAIAEDESMRSPQKRARAPASAASVSANESIAGIPALTFQKFGYYKYKVWRRQHMAFLGRQERELAIDGEYVYIMPPSEQSVLEQPKTTTFHIKQVVRCKRSSKNNLYCKIFVMKQAGPKRYDIECHSAGDCTEIVERINRLMRSQ